MMHTVGSARETELISLDRGPDANLGVLLAASEMLARVLIDTRVSASALSECLYYAAEEDLMRLMRRLAALDPGERAQVAERLDGLLSGAEPNLC